MVRRVALAALCGVLFAGGAYAGPVEDIVGRVSAAQYTDYLNNQLFTHAGQNRGYGPEHDLARARIEGHFQSLGLQTSLQAFTYQGQTYRNVVGTLPGGPETYIVGAHYDSVNNPGADDNASGVAGVMEAARVLSQSRFGATLKFIAFDREEQGLIGSQAYAAAFGGAHVKGMVSLDMIAYNDRGRRAADIYGRAASASVKNGLSRALLDFGGGIAPAIHDQYDASDQAPFEWRGMPAALLIESWGNPCYHTQSDNVDMPGYLDYAYATNMTRGAVGYLARCASPVPEPASLIALGVGALALARRRRR